MESAPPPVDLTALPDVPAGSSLGAEWWIAWGHLRSKQSEAFLSIVTILSIVGVLAGVAMLNWVISVMTGFEEDLRDKILGANAHVVVFRQGGILDHELAVSTVEDVEGVTAAAPFVYAEMMLRSPGGSTGVVTKGMHPEKTADVTHVMGDLVNGYNADHTTRITFEEGDEEARRALVRTLGSPFGGFDLDGTALPVSQENQELAGIVIGNELSEQLHVSVGDTVHLINPVGSAPGPMGMPVPSVKQLRVAGIFSSGMYEYDTKWTYVTNEVAQDFLGVGATVTGIEVKVADIDDVDRITQTIDKELGFPYYSRHWKNLNAKLFEALQLEKWVMGLLLNMIIVNAGLLIVTTLFMMVLTKGREIAILKAMGATSGAIMRIFMMEGAVIGWTGTILGTIAGLAGCEFLKHYQYPLETDVYYLNTLPVVVDPLTVVVIAVAALVTSFVATIYPAWRASKLDPVQALRYE